MALAFLLSDNISQVSIQELLRHLTLTSAQIYRLYIHLLTLSAHIPHIIPNLFLLTSYC